MKLIKLTCPNCGAKLDVELQDGKTELYCQYCGQKILVNPDYVKEININQNIHKEIHETYTNEAELKHAEAELKREETNAKKTDMDLSERNQKKEIQKKFFIILTITIVVALILSVITYNAPSGSKMEGIELISIDVVIWGVLILVLAIDDLKKKQ